MRASPDARIWIALGALIVVALLLSLGRTSSREGGGPEITPQRSTYRTRPSGLKALYVTLGRLGYRPRRHLEPLDRLRDDGTLVIAEPELEITGGEWEALKRWVERGNLLVLCSDTGHLFAPSERHRRFTSTAPVTAAPVQPVPVAAGAPAFVIRSPYRFEEERWSPERSGDWAPRRRSRGSQTVPRLFPPQPVVALYADAQGPALSLARWGKGFVLFSCSPWSLSNEGLGSGNNLALFLNMVDVYGGGKRRPVFFDEYHQGRGAAQGGLAGALSLLPPVARGGVAQVIAGLLLLVFAVSRRFGPAVPVERRERRARTEYLAAMTGLFRKARALELAAGKLKDETTRELARGLGLPPNARPEEIAVAAQEKRGMDAERVRRLLEEADLLSVASARRLPIDEGRVLAMAAKLHELRKECLKVE